MHQRLHLFHARTDLLWPFTTVGTIHLGLQNTIGTSPKFPLIGRSHRFRIVSTASLGSTPCGIPRTRHFSAVISGLDLAMRVIDSTDSILLFLLLTCCSPRHINNNALKPHLAALIELVPQRHRQRSAVRTSWHLFRSPLLSLGNTRP
jgi:hypothetical protein